LYKFAVYITVSGNVCGCVNS